MSADDNLHPVQFPRDKDGHEDDKAAELDAKGSDSDAQFGYSAYDMADYQYERYGHGKTDTNPGPEVF